MAELNNPVNAQNIVDRFADYVRTEANSGIVWGNNAKPFPEFNLNVFGGDTSGKSIGINGGSISSNPTDKITAQTIFNILINETAAYTRIRKMRAQLYVTGAGGNNGTRPVAGFVFDQEQVAHMDSGYTQTLTDTYNSSRENVVAGQTINKTNLENLFQNLRTTYSLKRDISAGTFRVDVCHASCHSSCCHSSRSRR